jgi:hypothetical protein
MRKIREVLRLWYDLGLLQNEIARSCSIGQASVHRYLERATAAGLSWPLLSIITLFANGFLTLFANGLKVQ